MSLDASFLDAVIAWHVRASVVLCAVLLAGWALRHARPRSRHRVLGWGLVAAVAVPTFAAARPSSWGVAMEGVVRRPAVRELPTRGAPPSTMDVSKEQVARQASASVSTWALPDVTTIAALVWLLGMGIGVGRAGAAGLGFASLRRSGRRLSAERQEVFDGLCRAAGVRTSVAICDRVDIPIVAGSVHPWVLLPAASQSWSAERWEAVVRHELGHVAQGDPRAYPAVHLARAVLWLNPLAWLAAAQFFEVAEFSADDAAVHGMAAPDYAAELLALARVRPVSAPAWTASVFGQADVGTRIRRILRPGDRLHRMRRVVPVMLGLAGAVGCVGLAQLAERSGPSEAELARRGTLVAPTDAVRVAVARDAIGVRDATGHHHDLETSSQPGGLEIPGLAEVLADLDRPRRPLVIEAEPDVSFERLVRVLYTAGKQGYTAYHLAVAVGEEQRVISVGPPMYRAEEADPMPPRVTVMVAPELARLSLRPASADESACTLPLHDVDGLRDAAEALCPADGGPVTIVFSALQHTEYETLVDTMQALHGACGVVRIVEAGAGAEQLDDGHRCEVGQGVLAPR